IRRRLGTSACAADSLTETGERVLEHLGVDRFLGLEVEVERGRRVARSRGDRAQRGTVQAVALEHPPRRTQDQAAFQIADGLLPAGFLLSHHAMQVSHLTVFSTMLEFFTIRSWASI